MLLVGLQKQWWPYLKIYFSAKIHSLLVNGMGTARLQMGIGREIYASRNRYGVCVGGVRFLYSSLF